MAPVPPGTTATSQSGRARSSRSAGSTGLEAERVVDLTGLYLAPGFIDMMGQTGAPFLKNPRAADSICTDMGPLGTSDALVHPRGQAPFPAFLARYVRELEVVPLERMIARMTAVAANDLKLHDRGRIAPGPAADLVVFDADRVRDRSTFSEPNLPSDGIIHVLVNGQFVIEQGKITPALPGRVLRRQGSIGPPPRSQ